MTTAYSIAANLDRKCFLPGALRRIPVVRAYQGNCRFLRINRAGFIRPLSFDARIQALPVLAALLEPHSRPSRCDPRTLGRRPLRLERRVPSAEHGFPRWTRSAGSGWTMKSL